MNVQLNKMKLGVGQIAAVNGLISSLKVIPVPACAGINYGGRPTEELEANLFPFKRNGFRLSTIATAGMTQR